ncbi:hypothetical protein BDV29DRAFT_186098, partial [Aspergillus leporis]
MFFTLFIDYLPLSTTSVTKLFGAFHLFSLLPPCFIFTLFVTFSATHVRQFSGTCGKDLDNFYGVQQVILSFTLCFMPYFLSLLFMSLY